MVTSTSTSTLRPCVICHEAVAEPEGIRAQSSDRWVHRSCLDLKRERVRNERRAAAEIKTATLLSSLPQSRAEDDGAMLDQAQDRLRRWHAGWARECNLSALVVAVSGSCKTLTLAAKMRVLIGDAIAAYADGDDSALDWIRGCYFTTAFRLCEATRQHPLGSGECPEVARTRTGSLVIIDDIGNENIGYEKWLLSIIDSRIAANLPTWVTSGFTVDDLTARYGQALVRRLCERGTGTLIDLFRAGAQLKAVR